MGIVCKSCTGKYDTFRFMSMQEYIGKTIEKMREDIVLPEYAAAGEQEEIKQVTEALRKNPFEMRRIMYMNIREVNLRFSDGNPPEPVTFNSYRNLYKVALFASEIGERLYNTNIMMLVYKPGRVEDIYQAAAVSYMDRCRVYMSDAFFKDPNMLTDAEICFILGHELGHARCMHSSINFFSGISGVIQSGRRSRRQEYSADRGGLISAFLWLCKQNPDGDPDKLADEAVIASVGALYKIGVAWEHYQKKERYDWRSFETTQMRKTIEDWFSPSHELSPEGSGTHPSDERRAWAMRYFSRSEMFRRITKCGAGTRKLYGDDVLNELCKGIML